MIHRKLVWYKNAANQQVRYYVRGLQNNSSSILSQREEASLVNLRQRTEYGFQVRAKTTSGWGEYSPPVYKKTGQLLGTGMQ